MSDEIGQASGPALRAVADSVEDAIISANPESCIAFWNAGATRLFGWSEEEAVGEQLTKLMPERLHESHLAGIERFDRTGEARIVGRGAVEVVGQRKNGEEFPVELTLAAWDHDGERWYTAVLRDITERKRAQEALTRVEAELQHQRDAQQHASQLQAGLLQSLLLAKYAMERAEGAPVREHLDEALDQALGLISELLGNSAPEPGSLRLPPRKG